MLPVEPTLFKHDKLTLVLSWLIGMYPRVCVDSVSVVSPRVIEKRATEA